MTLSPWIIYLWGIADDVKCTAGLAAIILALIAYALLAFGYFEDKKTARVMGFITLAFCIASTFVTTFSPSSNTIAVMVVAPAIVNSEPIQKDLPELYKAAKDALMKTLSDAK